MRSNACFAIWATFLTFLIFSSGVLVLRSGDRFLNRSLNLYTVASQPPGDGAKPRGTSAPDDAVDDMPPFACNSTMNLEFNMTVKISRERLFIVVDSFAREREDSIIEFVALVVTDPDSILLSPESKKKLDRDAVEQLPSIRDLLTSGSVECVFGDKTGVHERVPARFWSTQSQTTPLLCAYSQRMRQTLADGAMEHTVHIQLTLPPTNTSAPSSDLIGPFHQPCLVDQSDNQMVLCTSTQRAADYRAGVPALLNFFAWAATVYNLGFDKIVVPDLGMIRAIATIEGSRREAYTATVERLQTEGKFVVVPLQGLNRAFEDRKSHQRIGLDMCANRFAHRATFLGNWDVDEYIVPRVPDAPPLRDLMERSLANDSMLINFLFDAHQGLLNGGPACSPFDSYHIPIERCNRSCKRGYSVRRKYICSFGRLKEVKGRLTVHDVFTEDPIQANMDRRLGFNTHSQRLSQFFAMVHLPSIFANHHAPVECDAMGTFPHVVARDRALLVDWGLLPSV